METSREVLTARFLSRPIAFSSLEEIGEEVEVERGLVLLIVVW
jgi:hypothetical protein